MQVMGNAMRGVSARTVAGSRLGSFELCREVARTRQAVVMGNDRAAAPEPTTRALHELYGVPLMSGDDLLGVAYAGSSEREPLTERERSLFTTVAERAAWAIGKHGERTRLQAERTELLRREQLARREAELANRAKEEILGHAVPRAQDPTECGPGLDARARTKASPEVGRALDIVARNAEAQARMVDDMLDLSRITNGKLRLELTPLLVRDPICGALEAVRPAAEAKGVELSSEVDPTLSVCADADRLRQIVWIS